MNQFAQRQPCPGSIIRSYKNGNFTDLTITCGELSFEVHQVVVCSACEFFKKSLVFAGKEAEQRRIDLPKDDSEMIRRLITYLYLGDYDPTGYDMTIFDYIKQHDRMTNLSPTCHDRRETPGGFLCSTTVSCACLSPNTTNFSQLKSKVDLAGSSTTNQTAKKEADAVQVGAPLSIHATMYALGDKYNVEGLSQLAKEKFKSCLHHHAHTTDFADAVQIAYSSTPDSNRGLRDVVLYAFRTHFETDIAKIPGAEAKLDSLDELSFLLIQSWPTKIEPAKPSQAAFGGPRFGSSRPPVGPTLFGSRQPATSSGLGASQPSFAPSPFGGTPLTFGSSRP